MKHQTAGYNPLSKDNRIEAVRYSSLALSEILVAAIANRCQLSLFKFNIVVSLGWFSVPTRLATLILLREYFLHNRIVRNIRIIAMLASIHSLVDDMHFSVPTSAQKLCENFQKCAISPVEDRPESS